MNWWLGYYILRLCFHSWLLPPDKEQLAHPGPVTYFPGLWGRQGRQPLSLLSCVLSPKITEGRSEQKRQCQPYPYTSPGDIKVALGGQAASKEAHG